MTGRPLLTLVAVLGLVTGALAMVTVQAPAGGGTPRPASTPTEPPRTPSAVTPADGPSVAGPEVLLVWTAGGLPDGLAADVAALPDVDAVTTVAADPVDLVEARSAAGVRLDDLDDGWAVPLDGFAIDPATYAEFVPTTDQEAVATLTRGRALLGATSADLRGVAVGDVLRLAGGRELTVHGILDDTLVGAAEVVVARADAAAVAIGTDRFLLVAHDGDRDAVEAAIRAATSAEVRVRGAGEAPYLRHGDAVLPQALVKATFGEFAYRRTAGGAIVQDPAWEAAHVVTTEVPVLGTVRCHRGVVKQLRGALEELAAAGLAHLVDLDGYAGCHAARFVASGSGLSRHAWGIAVDLNARANPTGRSSRQDPRLIDTFTRWGFTWGGFWLQPDPMHLEWVGAADPAVAKVIASRD
jgi:hypothetical protein